MAKQIEKPRESDGSLTREVLSKMTYGEFYSAIMHGDLSEQECYKYLDVITDATLENERKECGKLILDAQIDTSKHTINEVRELIEHQDEAALKTRMYWVKKHDKWNMTYHAGRVDSLEDLLLLLDDKKFPLCSRTPSEGRDDIGKACGNPTVREPEGSKVNTQTPTGIREVIK